jgi:hypothetical protein
MEKLKASGLYGGALVPVSGSLAKRYNDCLSMLGVSTTTLTSFSVDAMGWSPEIALEKENNYYLSSGEANTNAIIVSPEQRHKPAHMPSHSFDRDLMEAVFTAYAKAIKDITKDAALCVHIDQKIDTFYDPFDLLRYDKITITFQLLNELDKRQKEQWNLIKTFIKDTNFIDRKLHNKLLTSAKTYGDLRKRNLELAPITLEVKSFYTRAFGGVFVLKDFIKDIMVFEDKTVFDKAIQDTGHEVMLYHKDHDELIKTLTSHVVIGNDLKRSSKSKRFERIKKHRFSMAIESTEHPFTEILDSHFLFKKYLTRLELETQKKINGVDIYFQKKIINKEIVREEYIDTDYFKALHHPHSSLEEEQKELIWKLLVKITPNDPVHLYWYDKAQFYDRYASWPATYQDWVISEILKENSKD